MNIRLSYFFFLSSFAGKSSEWRTCQDATVLGTGMMLVVVEGMEANALFST
jgi:hypothetical protein